MNRLLLRSELTRDEGERLRLYKCSSGKFTIGIGRNIEDNGISKDESELMFANDVDRVEKEARSIFGKWKSIEDARQRALVNMLFNLGMTRFLTFKRMIGAVIREDWDGAADEALNSTWSRQVGERANRIANMLRSGK